MGSGPVEEKELRTASTGVVSVYCLSGDGRLINVIGKCCWQGNGLLSSNGLVS